MSSLPIVHRIPAKSKTDPSKSYETLVYSDGSVSCNCKGWTRRVINGARSCKHTELVEGMLKTGVLTLGGTPRPVSLPAKSVEIASFDRVRLFNL